MGVFDDERAVPDETALVPVIVGGQRVYLSVREVQPPDGTREEQEIAGRLPKVEQVMDGLAEFAKALVERMQVSDASKISVEFGCEVALESGSFVAVIGKASARSTLKVGLEWVKPSP